MVFVDFQSFTRGLAAVAVSAILTSWYAGHLPTEHGLVTGLLLIISTTIQVGLGIYGLNSFYLIFRAMTSPPSKGKAERALKAWGDKPWPAVTVQLPIYNERYVIERLIKCCLKFDYPPEKLEIQVLDDSTDGTTQIVAECIERLRKTTKIKLAHLTRRSRTNFKAGALVIGTAQASGEFLAIFDADFVPQPEFLKMTIPRFSKSNIGCVQTRWGHLNYDHSLFTKLQAIGHDGHFVIEQHAKCSSDFTLNFNGTGGVWRRECIQEAGDWSGDTLAEDLDLSYRAQLKGWKIDYLRDVVVNAEVPLSISAFKKQQARWAKGSMQTALKLVQRVWNSKVLTNIQKIEGTIHLFGYGVHPLMLLNLLITVCLFFLTPYRGTDYILAITAVVAVGPPLIVLTSQLYLGHPERMKLMPLLIILHHGLCLSNTSAVFEAFKGNKGTFERTPKFGNLQEDSKWAATNYAKALRSIGFPFGELMMVVFLGTVMVMGLYVEVNYNTYPWLFFFLLGFLSIIGLHVQEYLDIRRSVMKASESAPSQSASKKVL